jgi:hypothetical protein
VSHATVFVLSRTTQEVSIGTRIVYCCHLLAQSALYFAFCYFSILWLQLLRFSAKVVKIAYFFATVAGTANFALTVVCCYQILENSSIHFSSLPAYKLVIYGSIFSLTATSLFFLGYGTYLQFVLRTWYGSGTGWQRGILVKVNFIVLTCTFATALRVLMVSLLLVEQYDTSGRDHYFDVHPILWIVFSQVIPNCLLGSVLFYMSKPTMHASVHGPVLDENAAGDDTYTLGYPREELLSSLMSQPNSDSSGYVPHCHTSRLATFTRLESQARTHALTYNRTETRGQITWKTGGTTTTMWGLIPIWRACRIWKTWFLENGKDITQQIHARTKGHVKYQH